jgi:hypothetical protein
MPRRHVLGFRLAIAAGIVVAGSYATIGAARSGASATQTRTIASATTSDFRAVLTATKADGGRAPAATVMLTTFTRREGSWKRTGVNRLGDAYFWKVVTGQRALCRFEIRTAGGRSGFVPRATIRLLLSPSLGCGSMSEFVLVR